MENKKYVLTQDSLYVFGTDEYRQEFPNLETKVSYDETFTLSFKFNAFRALICVYVYQVKQWYAEYRAVLKGCLDAAKVELKKQ